MSNSLREQRMRANQARIDALKENNQTAYAKAEADVNRLTEEIRKAEGKTVEYRGSDKENSRAFLFAKYLRCADLTPAEMKMVANGVERRDIAEGTPMTAHIGTYTGLGYFVPTGFANEIEQATKWFAPLMDVFRVFSTGDGRPIPFPTSNDTGTQASIVGEGGSITEADGSGSNLGTSQVTFGSYKYTSGEIKLSEELVADSAFDLEEWLGARFGERFGRKFESDLTNGTGGGSAPTGLLVAISASGATPIVAAGSSANDGSSATGANSIGYGDLVNLEHSVDPSYRRGAQYMFHDQTLAALKKLVDKYGRPLWAPGITAGDPDRLNGYEYVINQSMPQIAASATTVAFGDMSKYLVRKVTGISVRRLNELHALNGQIGFLATQRIDGNLLDAGTHPINVLQQHS